MVEVELPVLHVVEVVVVKVRQALHQILHILMEMVEQEEVEVHTQSVVVHLYSMVEEEAEVTTLNLT
jgi:hypothetical protein